MTLAKHCFSNHTGNHKGADGKVRESATYTYETTGRDAAIYDVVIIEGLQFVRVNMGPLSNFITDFKPVHYEIINHFRLNRASPRISAATETEIAAQSAG